MRHYFILLLCLSGVIGCETHDYWHAGESLSVNSGEGIVSSHLASPLSQELFVRYALDYELRNDSAQETQVVVGATSYVNATFRAQGQKVWSLAPQTSVQGSLGTEQLEIGNSLDVHLDCCSASSCYPKDVVCPSISAEILNAEDGAELKKLTHESGMSCFRSCQRTEQCIKRCPAASVCQEVCANAASYDKCMQDNCAVDLGLATCDLLCGTDPACLAKCSPAPSCVEQCAVSDTACFGNCLSSWTRCTGKRFFPPLASQNVLWLPCAMCGGEGMCGVNWEREENLRIYDSALQPLSCEMRCDRYPGACMKECLELHSTEDAKVTCAATCIEQHLYWCNNFVVAEDFLDTKNQQPCCYGDFCHNTLDAVVKTYEVKCFNDAECGVGRICSAQGVCAADSQASACSFGSGRTSGWPFFLFVLPVIIFMRRMRSCFSREN